MISDNFKIYRFSEENIGEVAALEKKIFSQPWSENSLRLLLTDEYPSFVICDEEGKRLAGYVSATKAPDGLQIINLAVSEDFRGRGLALHLMAHAEKYCRKNDIIAISLEVRESNIPAIKLYEKCGFVSLGIRKNFYKTPTENALVMIKNLD